MSRGLGIAQRLVLNALASLEAESGEGGRFYIWAIIDRVYSLSPGMQERDRTATEAHEAFKADVRERAEQGDDKAALYLSLICSLARRPSPRKRRSTPYWLTETRFNPSRILASLKRRGLVSRWAIQGGGSAGLTDEGRRLAAQLSVGTSCAETCEPVHG